MTHAVMPGLVPGIHVLLAEESKAWMAGTSPAMTWRVSALRHLLVHVAEHGLLGLVVELGLEGVLVLDRQRARGGGPGADLVDQLLHARIFGPGGVAERDGKEARPAPQSHVDDGVAVADHIFLLRQRCASYI